MKIESTILSREIENNNLKQTLENNQARLKKICITSSQIIETRNDLNRKLAETNIVLRSKAGKNAHALSMAKKEKKACKGRSRMRRGNYISTEKQRSNWTRLSRGKYSFSVNASFHLPKQRVSEFRMTSTNARMQIRHKLFLVWKKTGRKLTECRAERRIHQNCC